jgi:hypothetical protein
MRIPFPERIPLKYVAVFATILCVIQQLEGTDSYFSLCCFGFITLAGLAFNTAGGFSRASGGYVFFYATLTAIIGWITKALLGERADSNLLLPTLTVTVYVATMAVITISVYISRRITRRKAFLGSILTDQNSATAVIGCAVIGAIISLATTLTERTEGTALSFAAQVNYFASLAILIGVTYEVRRSGGARSLTLPVILAFLFSFVLNGVIGFSKEGLFTPIFCYLLAAASVGFRFTGRQVVFGSIGLYLLVYFMVPYSQYGRAFRAEHQGGAAFVETLDAVVTLMSDLGSVRSEYLAESATTEERDADAHGYFDHSQGLVDRLHMLSPDDELINATNEGKNLYGPYPLWYSVYNAVPRVFWPGKPIYEFGNLYAHEVGGLADDDFTTGISFSAAGQAYHMAKWFGVFVIAPPIFILFFAYFDSLCGDVRKSPWGLLSLSYFAHLAPEGMLDGCIYATWHFGVPLIAIALVCAYVMPIVGSLFIGPQKRLPGLPPRVVFSSGLIPPSVPLPNPLHSPATGDHNQI